MNLSPLPVPWFRVVLFMLCVGWFTLLAAWHRGVVIDDPWITFRYAQNLAEGRGWVFNEGEPLEGYSNFTWVWLAVAAHTARIEPLGVARLAGWLSGAALLAILCFGMPFLRDGEETGWRGALPRSGTAALLLASSYPLAVWAMGGLETVFHTLALFVYILLLAEAWRTGSRAMAITAGVALALVGMSRPEGAMYAALPVGLLLFRRDRPRLHATAIVLLFFALIYGVYTLWRLSTFGTVVPNTVSAKVGGEAGSSILAGLRYLGGYFTGSPGILLLLGVVGGARFLPPIRRVDIRPVEAVAIACGGAVALQLAFVVAVGGDWMPAARFLVPLLPPLCLLAAIFLRTLPLFVRLVALGFFLLAGPLHAREDPMLRWCRWAVKEQGGGLLVDPLVEMGRHLRDAAPPGSLLAATEAGVVPYYSRLPFIDMLGLVDAHIASMPGGLHEKFDASYVLGREPVYILLQYTVTGGELVPTWPSDGEMADHPVFREDYDEVHRVARPMTDGQWALVPGWLVLYQRRDSTGDSP